MDIGTFSSAKEYLKVPGSIESLWTSEQPQPKHWAEEMEEQVCSYCPECTWQQRVGGALFTLILGFFISLGSTFRLFQLLSCTIQVALSQSLLVLRQDVPTSKKILSDIFQNFLMR